MGCPAIDIANPKGASRAIPALARRASARGPVSLRRTKEKRHSYGRAASSGSYVGLDPVNATDPTGTQVFVGGQYDRMYNPMRNTRNAYAQAYPERRTWFVPHNDASAMQRALEESAASGQPTVVITHSRGFNTAMRGMNRNPDIPVGLLVTLDPVEQNDIHAEIDGSKPESVSLWVNIEGEAPPTLANLFAGDLVESTGEFVTGGNADTGGADVQRVVNEPHANSTEQLDAAADFVNRMYCDRRSC